MQKTATKSMKEKKSYEHLKLLAFTQVCLRLLLGKIVKIAVK